jgi:hypothetical protein
VRGGAGSPSAAADNDDVIIIIGFFFVPIRLVLSHAPISPWSAKRGFCNKTRRKNTLEIGKQRMTIKNIHPSIGTETLFPEGQILRLPHLGKI